MYTCYLSVINQPLLKQFKYNFFHSLLQLLDAEQRVSELDGDVLVLGSLAKEASDLITSTQNNLLAASDEVAQLYHQVCTLNGDSPSQVLLDQENQNDTESGVDLMEGQRRLEAMGSFKEFTGMARSVENLLDQIKFLASAVGNLIESSKHNASFGSDSKFYSYTVMYKYHFFQRISNNLIFSFSFSVQGFR